MTVVGAGLAGCEAALQLASRGVAVRLLEQKPLARTPAQSSDRPCELVCSNSLRGAALSNAVGLLKEEMRRLGSFVIRAADATRVPAGGALAVDRERFSARIEEWLAADPRVERVAEVVERVPDARPCIVATGPLTSGPLAADLERRIGGARLSYYDAIAPIVASESIDWDRVFFASRWDKGERDDDRRAYANCPLDREQYQRFVEALRAAEKVAPSELEPPRYFEGCLPIETMAERGLETLAFGPMKPVGLTDPRTGRWPAAVVQLRREDAAGTAWNLVGFQTRMLRGEQERVFRMIPGLERAEFERYGQVHRNTFLDAPALLGAALALETDPELHFAGQIAGTEGYVESAACGWLVAWFVAERLAGRALRPPPATTAHGALLRHLATATGDFQPSNVIFAHFEGWDGARLKKRARHEAMAARALRDLEAWRASVAAAPTVR